MPPMLAFLRWHHRPVRSGLALAGLLGVAIGLGTPKIGQQLSRGLGGSVARGAEFNSDRIRVLGTELAGLADSELLKRRHELLAICAVSRPTTAMRQGLARLLGHAFTELQAGRPTLACRMVQLYELIGTESADRAALAAIRGDSKWLRLEGRALSQLPENIPGLVSTTDRLAREFKRLWPSVEDQKLIDIARGWANRPMDLLVRAKESFLWTFHIAEPDDKRMCHGLKRLCDYALRERGETGYEIAVIVLDLFERIDTPLGFDSYLPHLDEVRSDWRRNRK